MSFKIIADTFSVASDSAHFIQLKTIKKPGTDDQIWIAFEMQGETKYARATLQSIVDILEELYFGSKEGGDTYDRFEAALKEVNLTIKAAREKKGEKGLGSVSAIVALFSGNELYLTQSESAEAYMIRKGKLSLISEGLTSKSEDLFVNIASGELTAEDKIIFSTSRLLRLVTQSKLIQLMGEGVTEAVDSIREIVLGENEEGNLGVVCMNVKMSQRPSGRLEQIQTSPWLQKAMEIGKKGLEIARARLDEWGVRIPWNIGKKGALMGAAAVVLLLVISVSVLMDSRHNQKLRDEYRIRIEAMNQDLNTATTKGYSADRDSANAILDKVERETRDILASSFFRTEALALLDKAQKVRDGINQTKRITEIKPYVTLGTEKDGAEALGLLSLDDNLFAYTYNRLYEIILDQVLPPKPIDETEIVVKGTALEDQNLLVFLTQSSRMIEQSGGQIRFANTEDASWKPAVDVKAYGRHIYVLSPKENQIYKYTRARDKFSSASPYNLDGDLADGISLAIDGNVYVLKKGGVITKLFKGKKEDFVIEDLAEDLSEATSIVTSPDFKNIYLLDPVNKKVLILEKMRNGGARYSGQIILENGETPRDFVIDRNEEKLYLLTARAIYQVSL